MENTIARWKNVRTYKKGTGGTGDIEWRERRVEAQKAKKTREERRRDSGGQTGGRKDKERRNRFSQSERKGGGTPERMRCTIIAIVDTTPGFGLLFLYSPMSMCVRVRPRACVCECVCVIGERLLRPGNVNCARGERGF